MTWPLAMKGTLWSIFIISISIRPQIISGLISIVSSDPTDVIHIIVSVGPCGLRAKPEF